MLFLHTFVKSISYASLYATKRHNLCFFEHTKKHNLCFLQMYAEKAWLILTDLCGWLANHLSEVLSIILKYWSLPKSLAVVTLRYTCSKVVRFLIYKPFWAILSSFKPFWAILSYSRAILSISERFDQIFLLSSKVNPLSIDKVLSKGQHQPLSIAIILSIDWPSKYWNNIFNLYE